MSASSKKKLRKAENETNLTERQLQEQKAAKKLKVQSIAFTVLIIAIVVITLVAVIWNAVDKLGLIPKWTTALTIGEHKLNCVEMNYYYRYAINYFLQSCGGSIETAYSIFGVNLYQPLDQQKYYEENRMWSDYFMEQAKELAISDYTMADMANAEGYKMTAEEEDNLSVELMMMESQANSENYTLDEYIRAYYGNGSDYATFEAFLRRNFLAESYRQHKAENFPVPEDSITKKNTDNFDKYSSFSYNTYSIPFNKYLTGGTTDDSGNTTYSEEENKAAEAAAKEAAELLAKATTVEEFDKAIAELAFNKELETAPKSTAQTYVLYDKVPEQYREWIAEDHKAGDTTIVDQVSTTYTDDVSTETVTGCTVVLFLSRDDNEEKLDNVYHILIPLGEDEVYGGTPSDSEMADYYEVIKEEAEQILQTWKDGAATKDSFIQLAAEKSADKEAADGLYENISRYDDYTNSEVFNYTVRDWAIDPARTVGETALVSSDLGYHVVYYAGESDKNYRQVAIEHELRTDLANEWYNNAIADAKANTKWGSVKPINVSDPVFVQNAASE